MMYNFTNCSLDLHNDLTMEIKKLCLRLCIWTWLINRSFHSAGTMLMGERPTVCALLKAADVGSWSSGAAAAAPLAQWPRDLSVSQSGVWCQAWCLCSHIHTCLFNTLQKSKYNHSTHSALMTHHQDNFASIALFSSCRFAKHVVAPPHVRRRTFSISLSCPLWLPYSESPVFLHRIILKTTHSLIDVYGNEEVASSKETPYGWEQHTDERHLQKALVNSWHA